MVPSVAEASTAKLVGNGAYLGHEKLCAEVLVCMEIYGGVGRRGEGTAEGVERLAWLVIHADFVLMPADP